MGSAAIVAAIQDIVFDLAGIRDAPVYPPEQINMNPTAVCWDASGTHRIASLVAPGCYEVDPSIFALVLLLPKKDLGREVETLLPYVDSVPEALLADLTLGDTVTAIDEVRHTFVEMEWGGVEMRGYRFEIVVQRKAQTF